MLLTCLLPFLATKASRGLEKKVNETEVVSKTVFLSLIFTTFRVFSDEHKYFGKTSKFGAHVKGNFNLPCCGWKKFLGTWVLCRCHGNTCRMCWVVGGLIICYSITLCCIFRSQWWIPTASPTQTLISWRVRGATGHQHQVSIGTVVFQPFKQKIHHYKQFQM